jgi:putative heme iron utilization protein
MNASDRVESGAAARRLIRTRAQASFGTSLEGRPYVSLVMTACDVDASPLLLLSDLAQHTRNLRADPHVSLLFEDTARHSEPLAGPRISLLGRAECCDDAHAAARFAARHPSSAAYADFADFRLYRVVIERGHLVAGFGRIAWIEADALRFTGDTSALAAAEAEIVAHMNSDHSEALQLYATHLLHRPGNGWLLTGIDPEGVDLWRPTDSGSETARLDFAEPVPTPDAARRALVAFAVQARQAVRQA